MIGPIIGVGHIVRYLLLSSFLKKKEDTTSENEVLYSFSQMVSHNLLSIVFWCVMAIREKQW